MSALSIEAIEPSQLGASPASASGDDRRNPAPLNSRARLLRAARCQPVDMSPVWLMRQAGRVLPEYRALKEKYSFLQLVQTPELAAEVTLQPIRRFHFDAAILFSDILVVPEALGQGYQFRENGGGIEMAFTLKNEADVERLEINAVTERLQYVAQAIRISKAGLGGHTALIGFAGSPWTLANFMLEGGSTKEFSRAKLLFKEEPRLFTRLMEKLTAAVTEYLQIQIDAGVDALQIFDSLGGILATETFEAASGEWMRKIVAGLKGQVPVIVFSKGTNDNWAALARTGAQVIGTDWLVSLAAVRKSLPEGIAVQGNLDPALLNATPEIVATATRELLESMKGCDGHIVNLGHGVPPTAKLECIESLVNTVRSFT